MVIKKSKEGFTLIELLIVITISAFIAASIAGGLITMQNITTIDIAARDLKTEIQATQNQARNSFISYDIRNEGKQGNLFQSLGNPTTINVGWLVSFENNGINSRVIRRAITFKPQGTYDISNLRNDIVVVRDILRNTNSQRFFCAQTTSAFILGSSSRPVEFMSNGVTYQLNCGQQAQINSDYFVKEFLSINFTNNLNNNPPPMQSCWGPNANQPKAIFFTAGYGEPAFIGSQSGDCQVAIELNSFGRNIKSISVSRDTGSVKICGNICTN
jgi:prepilin-type N-terminal cleavage/methylation domain-containing protein